MLQGEFISVCVLRAAQVIDKERAVALHACVI